MLFLKLRCISAAITMKRYVEANLSMKSHTTVKYFMKMLASVCDGIVFMYLGISVVTDKHQWNTAFVIATLVCCLIFRAIGSYNLPFIAVDIHVCKIDFGWRKTH